MSHPVEEGWLRVLVTRRPHQVVGPAHDPYLLRWFLLPRNRFVNVYLQTFASSELLNSARALSAREFVQQLDVPSHDIGDIGIIQKAHRETHINTASRGVDLHGFIRRDK